MNTDNQGGEDSQKFMIFMWMQEIFYIAYIENWGMLTLLFHLIPNKEVYNEGINVFKDHSNENLKKDALHHFIKASICIILLDIIVLLPGWSFYL